MNTVNFTASLHTHVRSLYDADIDALLLCKKIKALGGKGASITDHGSLAAIEDYRRVFSEEGLKLIPGCELYVDGGVLGRTHLIVLAKNDNGYKGLCKIVTAAERTLKDGFPVIDAPRLFEIASVYRDDMIVTSACMQGVICAIFLQNAKVQKKIDSIKAKQSHYYPESSELVTSAKKEIEIAQNVLDKAILERDETKTLAERSYIAREKQVSKKEEKGDEDASALRFALETDKNKSKRAATMLPSLKETVEIAKKTLSAKKKVLSSLMKDVEKYEKYESQIVELMKELKDEKDLYNDAKKVARKYQDIFGENFYIEVQNHGIKEEAICYPLAVKVAKELNIPIVAANDVHILEKTDDERLKRQILRSLRFGESFEEESVGDEELYLKTNQELKESLSFILDDAVVEESISNIDVIFDLCNVEFVAGKHYPKFSQTEDADALLDIAIAEGIKTRFPEGLNETYQQRLDYELSIIKSMGYSDYHLIVKDFLEYCRLLGYVPKERLDDVPLSITELKAFIKENGWKNQGLTTGPGRGSAAGSLACFILGITNIDPMKYGLLFERFLNPERITMPDIDSDMAATIRPKGIEYVRNKYGNDAVCGIMTITKQAPKGSINIAAKYYGLKTAGEPMTSLGRTIAKDVPEVVGVNFDTPVTKIGQVPTSADDETVSLFDYLCDKYSGNRNALEVLQWARVMENAVTAFGAHAAGIVISDNDDVSDYLPLRNNTKLMTTQCDMVQVEDLGLLKFDFLGLKTLDIITESGRMIEKNYGIIIDPLKIPMNDDRVYKEIFASGKTNAVFQFESDGMKSMLKRFRPENFEDLIILVSMFRPGPLQFLDGVIDVKNHVSPMEFLCPQLEPLLSKTYGAIVYQEQVMEIFQKLAGYTFGGADTVRRYMSKKKADKLAHEKESFIYGDESCGITGCVKNGISPKIAEELFSQMEEFAKYAFNKSHAACYAFIAYVTAWLKIHYPAEFFASALNWAEKDDIAGLMYEASNMGVKCLAPDVNLSDRDFSVVDGEIRFGLSQIKGVKNHADVIIKTRQEGAYTSLKDLFIRVNPNATVIENLIASGACDNFHSNRASMKQMISDISKPCQVIADKTSFIKSCEFLMPIIHTLISDEEVIKEQENAGLKSEIKKLTTAAKLEGRLQNAKETLKSTKKEVDDIAFHKVIEDKMERMNKEKELLGIYVTEHPMDFYPNPSELGATSIMDITKDDTMVYGVISDLKIKLRKSDGAKMAFFNLEDRSGDIEVCVFTKAFAKYTALIEEGKVILAVGKVVEEEDGETLKKKFIAEEIRIVKGKTPTILLGVSSYATFHIEHEEYFRKKYEDSSGCKFVIFDEAMNEMREMIYRVKETVKNFAKAEEIY